MYLLSDDTFDYYVSIHKTSSAVKSFFDKQHNFFRAPSKAPLYGTFFALCRTFRPSRQPKNPTALHPAPPFLNPHPQKNATHNKTLCATNN
jgi:hypothetical protein